MEGRSPTVLEEPVF